ncbi:hypothetical protein Cgig2_021155 [Carnegiea gigantea]|uniref:Uncharacterized protein n=1 Tax=Carnegiea gigantea TaxID=171969 RepID=A0A9Q1KW80_9CARY|nr:hypothetical protein Cgig2_021155 [Carnegiea gigantea]
MLRSLLFDTISGDMLVEVRDLIHSYQIWDRLHRRFQTASLAKTLELHQRLTNLKKQASQPIDSFLREIKNIVDSFTAINSRLTDQELVQYTIDGLDDQYEVFVTDATYFGGHLTFDELCTKLIIYEPRVTHLCESSNNTTCHQALATSTMASPHFHNSRNAPNSNNSRHGRDGYWHANRSNRGRNGGRDRGSNNTSGRGTQHQSSPSAGQDCFNAEGPLSSVPSGSISVSLVLDQSTPATSCHGSSISSQSLSPHSSSDPESFSSPESTLGGGSVVSVVSTDTPPSEKDKVLLQRN